MNRSIKWVIACIALLLALAACAPDSTSGVQVIGDNVARLPAGETMVLYKPSKMQQTWRITYDGDSTVNFACDEILCPDRVAILGRVGEKVSVSSNSILQGDFYASRRSDGAVNVEWPFGLGFQEP